MRCTSKQNTFSFLLANNSPLKCKRNTYCSWHHCFNPMLPSPSGLCTSACVQNNVYINGFVLKLCYTRIRWTKFFLTKIDMNHSTNFLLNTYRRFIAEEFLITSFYYQHVYKVFSRAQKGFIQEQVYFGGRTKYCRKGV